ncbi:hypothetical protein L873DRAFT_247050 [Choiromyces venosus 120613-1]|uniref:Uncharacterized protein n=1 Tax=Choiromyces venosus 120613-1 TaxID=1336337 RepID=A0A3N4J491_9PEZI|nr:hypothetical protein L873DRAFT_247050 [Choiromyces venosus 120613-1]
MYIQPISITHSLYHLCFTSSLLQYSIYTRILHTNILRMRILLIFTQCLVDLTLYT